MNKTEKNTLLTLIGLGILAIGSLSAFVTLCTLAYTDEMKIESKKRKGNSN